MLAVVFFFSKFCLGVYFARRPKKRFWSKIVHGIFKLLKMFTEYISFEDKRKMIELAQSTIDEVTEKQFLDFVLQKVHVFDAQASDMFLTSINIRKEFIARNKESLNKILPYLNINKHSQTSILVRFEYLKELINS